MDINAAKQRGKKEGKKGREERKGRKGKRRKETGRKIKRKEKKGTTAIWSDIVCKLVGNTTLP